MLTQESARSWTTTVLIAESPSCLKHLTYQLVTTSPDYLINGMPTGTAAVEPVSAAPAAGLNPVTLSPLDQGHLGQACGQAAGADSEVSLKFTLPSPFPTIPLGATLVVDDTGGLVPAAAVLLMTMHRLVTGWQYLGFALTYGGIMAALLLIGVAGIPLLRFLRARRKEKKEKRERHPDRGRDFLHDPIYASASWTFADSPATSITTVGTILVAILAAVGTASTLLPGVQLDRFAILMAVCAAIIAMAPLAFGVFNTWSERSRGNLPDNAGLVLSKTTIDAPGGAGVTFTEEATITGPVPKTLKAGATVPVPPRSKIEVDFDSADGLAVFPGDSSILLRSVQSVTVKVEGNRAFTIPADALRREYLFPIAAPGRLIMIPNSGQESRLRSGEEIRAGSGIVIPSDSEQEIPVRAEGTGGDVTVKANGFVELMVPKETRLMDPTKVKIGGPVNGESGNDKGRSFRHDTWVRVPLVGDKTIVADMRSLMPAIMISVFGIGAEFGLLTVLGGQLSAEPGLVHWTVRIVVALLAVFVLVYTVTRTNALASTTSPGSSLAPDTRTAAMP